MATIIRVKHFSIATPMGQFSHYEVRLDGSHDGTGITIFSTKDLDEAKAKQAEINSKK